MSDTQLVSINGQITVTKGIRHDGMWSVSCVYYSNTGRGKLQQEYVSSTLMDATIDFDNTWMQAVIDFEAGN